MQVRPLQEVCSGVQVNRGRAQGKAFVQYGGGYAVRLAKIDVTTETNLAQKYQVSTYPTLKFFIEGNPIPYNGQFAKDDVMRWIERKLYPAVV